VPTLLCRKRPLAIPVTSRGEGRAPAIFSGFTPGCVTRVTSQLCTPQRVWAGLPRRRPHGHSLAAEESYVRGEPCPRGDYGDVPAPTAVRAVGKGRAGDAEIRLVWRVTGRPPGRVISHRGRWRPPQAPAMWGQEIVHFPARSLGQSGLYDGHAVDLPPATGGYTDDSQAPWNFRGPGRELYPLFCIPGPLLALGGVGEPKGPGPAQPGAPGRGWTETATQALR
jgi:hypothetical protein